MSELFEKRAAKDGFLTPKAVLNEIKKAIESGEVETFLAVYVDKDGDVQVCWSSGDPLTYMGLCDVAKNDLLVEVLEGMHGSLD